MIQLRTEYSINVYPEESARDDYKSYMSRTRRQIETELARVVTSCHELDLHPQIEYAVMSKGKRLRPLMAILSAESVGGDRNRVMSLALAFELVHTATLVQDDIIDQDEIRRGKAAVYRKWSVGDAILTGDALIALAVDLVSGYGETIVRSVAKSALELSNGEQLDMTFDWNVATEEWYFRKIIGKSASLFRAAAYCGALAGGGTHLEALSLSMFGENFGIAYQLRDDLLDLAFPVDSIPKDLKAARLTLPLIHLYGISDLRRKEKLEKDMQLSVERGQSPTPGAFRRIQTMLRETGSTDYCRKRITEYIQEAIDAMMPIDESEFKSHLIQMAESLVA